MAQTKLRHFTLRFGCCWAVFALILQAPEIFYANVAMRRLLTICCPVPVILFGSTEGYAYKASAITD